MACVIVILEDNEDRRAAMRQCLEERFYQFESRFFADAAEAIGYLESNLDQTISISLDHDLELIASATGEMIDPGTGRDIADYLSRKSPVCPVIIATTNSTAALGMERVLQEASWETHRVVPFDDLEWILGQWFRCMRRVIVGSAQKRIEHCS
jgi:CheY-like chemotaxis protein